MMISYIELNEIGKLLKFIFWLDHLYQIRLEEEGVESG